jgi:hypothetical protein
MTRDFTANAGALFAATLFGAFVVAVRVAVQDIPPVTLAILRLDKAVSLIYVAGANKRGLNSKLKCCTTSRF